MFCVTTVPPDGMVDHNDTAMLVAIDPTAVTAGSLLRRPSESSGEPAQMSMFMPTMRTRSMLRGTTS